MTVRHLVSALALGAALFATREASAFCGFYVGGADAQLFNNATQVALLREGTRTVLSMQNNYQGPPDKFAMVVPVPVVLQKENVKTLPREIFAKLDALSAPRLVEYWEQDPCQQENVKGGMRAPTAAPQSLAAAAEKKADNLGVKIEAQFAVGEYDVVILSAQDSTGLDKWLRQEKYNIPKDAEPYLRPYVASGSKFFVAKVDPAKVTFKDGMATLSPLRFHYDSDAFSLPVRLGLINSSGAQDLIVNILAADQRFEVSNYKNVTIPTNFDVGENAREQFGAFYAALFDRTLEKNPGAVVTEYSWQASTCDPCPGPALYANDFLTLGADVAPRKGERQVNAHVQFGPRHDSRDYTKNEKMRAALQQQSSAYAACGKAMKTDGGGLIPLEIAFDPKGTVSKIRQTGTTPLDKEIVTCVVEAAKKASLPSFEPGTEPIQLSIYLYGYTPQPNYVVTRLHARYTKEALGEDLVFRAAPAIQGGREVPGADGKLEHGALPASMNNFQGRYAIRHPWTGPVTCTEPRRGIWGGPPAGATGNETSPRVARDLAFAPRKGISLASYVRGDISELDVKGSAAQPAPVPVPSSSAASPWTAGSASPAKPSGSACGACAIGSPAGNTAAFASLGLLGLALARRRRR